MPSSWLNRSNLAPTGASSSRRPSARSRTPTPPRARDRPLVGHDRAWQPHETSPLNDITRLDEIAPTGVVLPSCEDVAATRWAEVNDLGYGTRTCAAESWASFQSCHAPSVAYPRVSGGLPWPRRATLRFRSRWSEPGLAAG